MNTISPLQHYAGLAAEAQALAAHRAGLQSMWSDTLDAFVELKLELLEACDYQHCHLGDDVKVEEIWLGTVNLTDHLSHSTWDAIDREASRAFAERGFA